MSFEEKEHTADILMHIRAGNLEDLFSEAGHALMKTIYRGQTKQEMEISIQVVGETPEHLLHSFLSELLFESEVANIVFSEFLVTIEDNKARIIMRGEPFCSPVHGGGTEVKGISWHNLSITREKDEYSCDILFDV
ncbi:MAG: archease [Methanomicrobiales archaeon]|nr:archease [Methanomicrobiales archaeon]